MTASLASARSVFSGAKPFLNFAGDGKDIGGILGVAGIELIRLLFHGSKCGLYQVRLPNRRQTVGRPRSRKKTVYT